MKFISLQSTSSKANAITVDNKYLLVIPAPEKHGLPTIEAKTLNAAIKALNAIAYSPTLAITLRSLTKRELVDRLIERGLAEGFAAILDSLPLAERLRYDASPTISPEYPYIAENLVSICAALNISEEQFKDIFR